MKICLNDFEEENSNGVAIPVGYGKCECCDNYAELYEDLTDCDGEIAPKDEQIEDYGAVIQGMGREASPYL
jgi:hypothetical protein